MNKLCPWGRKISAFLSERGVSRYQYWHLDDALKPAYLELENGITSGTAQRVVIRPRIEVPDVTRVFHALQQDNPWIFDVTGLRVTSGPDYTIVDYRHNYTAEERRGFVSQIVSVAERISAEVSSLSDYDKELRIHDYLVRNTKYDLNARNAYNVLGPLIDGCAVCQGISLAASFLLNWCGVDAGVINGVVRDNPGVGHAWNIVWLGEEYHLDVTFDLHRSLFGGIIHHYFNLSDELMGRARTWSTTTVCRSMDSNYYSVEGDVVYSRETLPIYLGNKAEEERGYIEFRLSQKICDEIDARYMETLLRRAMVERSIRKRFQIQYMPLTGCCTVVLL